MATRWNSAVARTLRVTSEIGPFRIVKKVACVRESGGSKRFAGDAARAWRGKEAARQQEKFEHAWRAKKANAARVACL